MATIMPTLLPFGTIILISLPFFVAVTAVIVYANKHIKKVGDIVEDKEDEDANDDDSLQLSDSTNESWL